MSEWANLVHELGMLARLERSGLLFLGSGRQTVAEHSHRVACIALMLARRCEERVDEARLAWLCLFHDLPETRIGDHNYVNRKYLRVDMERLCADIGTASPLGKILIAAVDEFEKVRRWRHAWRVMPTRSSSSPCCVKRPTWAIHGPMSGSEPAASAFRHPSGGNSATMS